MSQQDFSNDTAGEQKLTGRVALCIAYNGFNYFGWQAQKNGLATVQKFLEEAISKVANEPISVVCAGRTDKSVHSSYQVVHFDTTVARSQRSWVFGCNSYLPKDISVFWAGNVSSDFHARFSALSRRYNYVIYNHPIRPANFATELTWFHRRLNAKNMHQAAQCLVGEHDFTSFRAAGCQSKSPFRYLEFVNVQRFGDIVLIDIKGNAFLHHMVRNIAGVLMAIGSGEKDVSWCSDVLLAKNRSKASITAPPNGLFLSAVEYPDHFNIPRSSGSPPIIQSIAGLNQNGGQVSKEIWDLAYLD